MAKVHGWQCDAEEGEPCNCRVISPVPPDNGAAATRMNSVPRLLASHRRDVERAIEEGEHPKGMSTHDGKARVPAYLLRRMLQIIDAATPPGAAAAGSTGNAEVSNETPTPSLVSFVPREPTEAMFRDRTPEAAARQLGIVLAWAAECELATLERLQMLKKPVMHELRRHETIAADLVRHCVELGVSPNGLNGRVCGRLAERMAAATPSGATDEGARES